MILFSLVTSEFCGLQYLMGCVGGDKHHLITGFSSMTVTVDLG